MLSLRLTITVYHIFYWTNYLHTCNFPTDYVFDGHENDNLRWMNNDIAVIKVEDEFDFSRRVRGCDFVPKPICYNNQSSRYENPGNTAIIAGWGSTDKYYDV